MGLKFLKSKTIYPDSQQALLGITLDILHRECSLKPGKASKVVDIISKSLAADSWVLKEIQSITGNSIWLSMLLPRIRSYITPLCEVQKLIQGGSFYRKDKLPELDKEIIRSLNFLEPIFAMDPAVHVNRFLNLLPVHSLPLWSDASGGEIDSKNPTPRMLASFFLPPFVQASHLIFYVTPWDDIFNMIKQEGVSFANLPWTRLDTSSPDLQIAFLELSALFLTFLEVFLLCIKSVKFAKRFARKQITIKCDNSNCVSWFNKGRVPFFPWNRLMEFIFYLEYLLQARFVAEWVPSERQKADGLTRGVTSIKRGKQTINASKHSRDAQRMLVSLLCYGVDKDLTKVLKFLPATRDYSKKIPFKMVFFLF